MPKSIKDDGLENLLDLDGQILVIDEKGGYWVKFKAKRTSVSPECPHGISYSLTLHTKSGERLVGFDNAHAVEKSRTKDHRHRYKKVKPYHYTSAYALLED